MSPEKNEPKPTPPYPVNLFDESRDHANQWEITAIWDESKPEVKDPKPEPDAE
jgi:hypothetical protein